MKKQLLFLFALFFSVVSVWAQHSVSGLVVSLEDDLPVIGASVVVKGTTQGTITDVDGKFSIEVPNNSAFLQVSYVGMADKDVRVGDQKYLKIELSPKVEALEEVVVVAMGVKAEKKKLNYAVQTLSADEVNAGQSANFVNSLQGKIAGIQVSNAGGSVNAGSQIQIRAISSINPSQNNEPLFVIDGLVINGSGTNMGNINPNDIENMTVLKGAAASALYGAQAANGVIMITTKSGKEGAVTVNGGVSLQIENALRVPELQGLYGPGAQGFYKSLTEGGWGPLVQPGEMVYDNVGDFLGTGLFQKYDVSVSGGTETFNAYASANYMHNKGVIPNDYREQFGALIKAQFKPSKWVTLNASLNTVKTNYRSFGNSMSSIYAWPITNNMSYYKTPSGEIVWRDSWDGLTDQEKLDMPMNPYWSRYEDKGENYAVRNIMMAEIVWNPIENLRFTGRLSYDESNSSYDGYSTPRYDKTDFTDESLANSLKSEYGEYRFTTGRSSVMNGNIIGQYSIKVLNDFDISLLLGGEFKEYKGLESALGGYDFVVPGNFFSVQNLNSSLIDGSNLSLYHSKRRQAGLFGELKIDYKGLAHISATCRNDYSSTLSERDYFYPSVTAGVIFSELFQISSPIFSYGKLRGNWARVGKDARSPYLFDRKFYQRPTFPDQGFSVNPTSSVATHLDPEMCDSWEIGTDLRFFNNKTTFDIAYYSTEVSNQIVTVRVSPAGGNILETRNEGAVKNHGVEIQANQKIMSTPLFTWDAGLNFALNRSKVVQLPEGLGEIQGSQYGDAFTSAYLNKSTTSISGKDYLRNPQGQIICTADGIPMINPAKGVWIGDREPNYLVGVTSNFRWKDLTVSFLFDTRKGGDVLNVTKRSLLSNGQLKLLETYRNRWIIIDGVVDNGDGTYSPNRKPMLLNQTNINNYINNVTSNFIEDGSYVRLSYVTIGYDLSRFVKKAMKGLKVSLTGRNLFLWTHYSGSDPMINANPSAQGTGSKGIDNFGVPPTRSFNLTVNATF